MKIAVIAGTTRPERKSLAVARWVFDLACQRTDAAFELVDLRDYDLPLFDEPLPPSLGQYSHPHTIRWASKIATFDGYVFVTAEYNHGIPAALKNAVDYLFREWNNKAAGFVSYGSMGGARAVEHLRTSMAELMVATVRSQVMLLLSTDFDAAGAFKPEARRDAELHVMLDQLIAWGAALRRVRIPSSDRTTGAPTSRSGGGETTDSRFGDQLH